MACIIHYMKFDEVESSRLGGDDDSRRLQGS